MSYCAFQEKGMERIDGEMSAERLKICAWNYEQVLSLQFLAQHVDGFDPSHPLLPSHLSSKAWLGDGSSLCSGEHLWGLR